MKTLKHPNIVELYDFYSESTRLCLVIELLNGGELFDRIIKRKAYNESVARDAIRNVFIGLKYMHDINIAHRDLKPENLLLAKKDDDSDLKIADFGFARCDASAMVTQCGTPNYVAPEVLYGHGHSTSRGDGTSTGTGGNGVYTKAVDMWSMGIILFIILGGYPPFQHKNQAKLFQKIKKGHFEFHEKYWSHISPEAKDLIRKLLELNPQKRFTVAQALEHPWVPTDTSPPPLLPCLPYPVPTLPPPPPSSLHPSLPTLLYPALHCPVSS
jgi:calcium/calmodulin-dependent protein kinase I